MVKSFQCPRYGPKRNETTKHKMKNKTQELIEQVKQARAGLFTSITTVTPVKMNKGRGENINPLHGEDIQKESIQSAQFCSYSNAVNNKQVREGGEADFEAQPLPDYLEYVDDCRSLVRNIKSGQVYIQYKPNGKANVQEIARVTENEKGEEIRTPLTESELQTVREWQPKPKPSAKTIEWRRVKIENVKAIA